MKSLLKSIQYDLLDFIEGEDESDYCSEDVTACITMLLEFLSSIESEVQTIETANTHVHTLVLALNELNEDCAHCLIETGQREDICEFIQQTLLAANIEIKSDITEQWRDW